MSEAKYGVCPDADRHPLMLTCHCDYRSLTARQIAAEELLSAANEYETDGAIVDALASQARNRGDLAGEAAYAITASDFQHIVGRLRERAEGLVRP